MVNVDYIKEAERVLYARPALDIALNNLRGRLKSYDNAPDCEHISGELSELLSGSDYVKKKELTAFMSRYVGALDTQHLIRDTEAAIYCVDRSMKELSPPERELLELWYYQRKDSAEISQAIGYTSVSTLGTKRNAALARFALLFFYGIWGRE